MPRITRFLFGPLVLGVVLAVLLTRGSTPPVHRSPAAVHPVIGIGDNKLDFFSDPKFLALGIKHVRYDMSWDALSVPWQRAKVTAWMNAAQAHGLSVLVTIDHSDRVIYRKVAGRTKLRAISQSRVMPTVAQYLAAFKAFRALFPWVTEFATWDETNCYCEVSFDQVATIAADYLALRAACPKCTILAAEFLDVPRYSGVPMTTWAAQLIKDLGVQPQYWGLNNYEDANHLVSTRTRRLLAVVHGNLWLAETGGIVNRPLTKNPDFPQNAAHAAAADRYLLDSVGSISPRLQRIYLYEWNASTPRDGWDSALISSAGSARDSYAVLANTLSSWGIRPNCAISVVPPACAGLPGVGSSGPAGATTATGATGAASR